MPTLDSIASNDFSKFFCVLEPNIYRKGLASLEISGRDSEGGR